jgi:carboxylesterase type B
LIATGLSVGLQIMAYGGSEPVPFQKAIAQSQVLEPGITGNFTQDAMARVLDASSCNTTSVDSQAAIDCLRTISANDLIKLQTATAGDSENIGDIWLPTVDGDILPAAPSQLLYEGRFAAIPTIMGYTEDDTAPFTDIIIKTANQTATFFQDYAPAMSESNLQHLLSLYPVEEFAANPSANLSAEYYRSARILRDILMVCEPLLYGKALAQRGQNVYYYDQNQTVVDGPLESLGLPGLGVVHTSEFAYMFNNLSHYDSKQKPRRLGQIFVTYEYVEKLTKNCSQSTTTPTTPPPQTSVSLFARPGVGPHSLRLGSLR